MMTILGARPCARTSRQHDVERIKEALDVVASFLSDMAKVEAARSDKSTLGCPLDRDINSILHVLLPRRDEGWLSEETPDDLQRLTRKRIWIVDPLDGTREFLLGLPEWGISIGLIEDGTAVAGGILNPSTGEMFLGSDETGLTVIQSGATGIRQLVETTSVLVSRREYDEGKWTHFQKLRLPVTPVGSVAYRLAQVAAGRAAATCTFMPRHEWDVAAGVALVNASGGRVQTLRGEALVFNRPAPRFESLVALSSCCDPSLPTLLSEADA